MIARQDGSKRWVIYDGEEPMRRENGKINRFHSLNAARSYAEEMLDGDIFIETTTDIPMAREHIVELISQHSLTVKEGEFGYDPKMKEVFLSPIQDGRSYWYALHECGHAILGHTVPVSWDHEVRMEIECWEWVYVNSVISVPDLFKEEVELTRIKGGWEHASSRS